MRHAVHPPRALSSDAWLHIVLLLALASPLVVAAAARAQVYTSRVSNGSDVWLNVTNHGVLGNNFVSRSASFEYPGGVGYEHLTHAGLWLGAQATDGTGPFTGVVTGGLDQFLGNNTASLTEYSPLGTTVQLRSSDPLSPAYSPDAISDHETLAFFDDHQPKAGSPEPHRPIGLTVRQVTHAWTHPAYRDLVIVRYIVTSQSAHPVQDLWVGMYSELSSGNKSLYANWPPSGSWFNKKLIEWDPTWRMLREHYCANLPVPAACNFQLVPPWVGVQLLTSPGQDRELTLAAWQYAPGDASRDQDVERYAQMTAGTIANLAVPELGPRDGDPTELIATGPFQLPSFGDSVEVAFAFVGGADIPSLQQHARSAQTLADNGYLLGVVSAPPARAGRQVAISPSVNPAHAGSMEFVLDLPEQGDVRIELLDLAGRIVAHESLGALPAGTPRVAFTPSSRLAPGIYVVRLIHRSGTATTRVARLR